MEVNSSEPHLKHSPIMSSIHSPITWPQLAFPLLGKALRSPVHVLAQRWAMGPRVFLKQSPQRLSPSRSSIDTLLLLTHGAYTLMKSWGYGLGMPRGQNSQEN